MYTHPLAHLFQPFLRSNRIDGLGLQCHTIVVKDGVGILAVMADMLLIASSKGEIPIEGRELIEILRRLEWAVRDEKLYGPKELVIGVEKPEDMADIDAYRVKVVDVETQEGEPSRYLARLEPKAELSEQPTSVGMLQTVWLKGMPVLRLLRLNCWKGLYETAKHVSREIAIGIDEQLFLVDGESPSLGSNAVSVAIHPVNGITAVVVSVNNPNEVKPQSYLVAARALLSNLAGNRLAKGDVRGRIPDVLPNDRLLQDLDAVTDRGPNRIVQALTGFTQTPLIYGATDIGGNWVELLQLWVACYRSGLPGVFDIEVRAHTIGSYWDRILSPSVALIGGSAELPDSLRGLSGEDMTMAQLTRVVNLPQVDGVVQFLGLTVPEFYIQLHRQFVGVLNSLFGASVEIAVVEGEKLFRPIAEAITVGQAVDIIHATLKEDRIVGNGPDGRQIRISDIGDERTLTVAQWMDWGVWPGGALTYLLMGGLAHHGPAVFNLKDSRLGNVSLTSVVDLANVGDGINQGAYAISGVTRCYPKYSTRAGGDNVDLLILFEMLARYPDRVKALLREMVNRWVFPLGRSDMGMNQVFEVRYHGGWSFDRRWEGPNANNRS